MTGTATTARQDFIREMLIDAKAVRDADGTPDARADAIYTEVVTHGNYGRFIAGWTAARGAEHRPDGHQGSKPETVARIQDGRMVGERPAAGKGTGRYGAAKQTVFGPSDKQVAFIEALLADVADPDAAAGARRMYEKMTADNFLTGGRGGTASKFIDSLQALIKQYGSKRVAGVRPAVRTPATPATPAPRRTHAPLPAVEDGYYATPGADGALRFYRVKTHARSGRVYVNVQASDDWHDVHFSAYRAILDAVAADPAAAARRYAAELGRCFRCNRTLTDAASRARGRGPICADLG